jgi:type III restriction enzyme
VGIVLSRPWLSSTPPDKCHSSTEVVTIPYTLNGEEKQYYPDFIARIDELNVIVEVTGEARKDKAAKVTTARTLWVPVVNNHGGFGRWAFIEITDPWDAQRAIRAAVRAAEAVQC